MSEWKDIATTTPPRGEWVLLYFSKEVGRNALPQMFKVDRYPVGYPRQPTHWMPLPSPPTLKDTP